MCLYLYIHNKIHSIYTYIMQTKTFIFGCDSSFDSTRKNISIWVMYIVTDVFFDELFL